MTAYQRARRGVWRIWIVGAVGWYGFVFFQISQVFIASQKSASEFYSELVAQIANETFGLAIVGVILTIPFIALAGLFIIDWIVRGFFPEWNRRGDGEET